MNEHEKLVYQRVQSVIGAPTHRLDQLVRLTGLDPSTDLRFGDWRNCDFTSADLRGFNFTGADLTNACFRNTRIVGAIFDRSTYDHQSLQEAADFSEFLIEETGRSAGKRRRLSDRGLKDLDVYRDTPACPELIALPAGNFEMGTTDHETRLRAAELGYKDQLDPLTPEDRKKRSMRVSRRFSLGRYPVTFEEYDIFLSATKDRSIGAPETSMAVDPNQWGRGRRPVINVSLDDAESYCDWLNQMTGRQGEFGYRLPSEAEWEYACRAGTHTRRWWGDDWTSDNANANNSFEGGRTNPVDYYSANPWGLHDMIGNVWEWCADKVAEWIRSLPEDGAPLQGYSSKGAIMRGGSWNGPAASAHSAGRLQGSRHVRLPYVGFRVARTLTVSIV